MTTSITLTPDQLAQIVVDYLAANGIPADTIGLYLNGELVGYDAVVIPIVLNTNQQKNRFLESVDKLTNPLIGAQNAIKRNGRELG